MPIGSIGPFPNYVKTFEFLDARELLRTWREDVVRRSEDIVSIWEEILIDTQADLGDERWMILEQVRSITKYGTSLIRRNLPEIVY